MACSRLPLISHKPGVLVRQQPGGSHSQCTHCGAHVGKEVARGRRNIHCGVSRKRLWSSRPVASPRLVCWCSGSTEDTSKMKQTMADLDAILGIEEEEEEKKEEENEDAKPLLDPMVKEEVEKAAQDANSEGDLAERMTRVVETAVKMADGKAGNEELREKVENLIESLNDVKLAPSEDIKKMKESVFGSTGFWVTEAIPPNATSLSLDKRGTFGDSTWITFRGNMRGDSAEVFAAVDAKMKEIFGDKYVTFLTEEKDPDDMGEAKIVFKVYPKVETVDDPANWETILLWGLLIFSAVSTVQLGITANLLNLPKETLDYLARPENYDPEVLAPGLEGFDFSRFFLTALPISGGVFAAQLFHEAGHKIYASLHDIYTSPPFLIPNSQLGIFGAITQLREPVRDRRALWDFSFAGVALGGGVSLALLIYGLVAGQDSSLTPDQLVPVPSSLLQGSLLLGTFIKLAVGGTQAVGSQPQILLHPMTVAGWCGLVATAFNLLPVGRLDGGRLLLAAYGKDSLYAASIFVYAGLGLGVLGSALALPFGLFVLICQREFEDKYCDQVTPLDQRRSSITIGLIFVALLILLPVFPSELDSMGGGMTL